MAKEKTYVGKNMHAFCSKCGLLPLPRMDLTTTLNGIPVIDIMKDQIKCRKCKTLIEYLPENQIKGKKRAGTLNDWILCVELEKEIGKLRNQIAFNLSLNLSPLYKQFGSLYEKFEEL